MMIVKSSCELARWLPFLEQVFTWNHSGHKFKQSLLSCTIAHTIKFLQRLELNRWASLFWKKNWSRVSKDRCPDSDHYNLHTISNCALVYTCLSPSSKLLVSAALQFWGFAFCEEFVCAHLLAKECVHMTAIHPCQQWPSELTRTSSKLTCKVELV
jgi:hypothetical protein